jgi:hypothetical protein
MGKYFYIVLKDIINFDGNMKQKNVNFDTEYVTDFIKKMIVFLSLLNTYRDLFQGQNSQTFYCKFVKVSEIKDEFAKLLHKK